MSDEKVQDALDKLMHGESNITARKLTNSGNSELLGAGWKTVREPIPIEPHRNVEVAHLDAIGKLFVGQVSSRLANGIHNSVMWREVI